jgi:P27 family predicted phage terminase small subunit
MKSKPSALQPPKHLKPETAAWYAHITSEYELESHHYKLLIKACEAHDRGEEARLAIAEHGLVYEDRFGAPKTRPEVAVERDSRISFARLCREIGMDLAPPAESRPNALRANR